VKVVGSLTSTNRILSPQRRTKTYKGKNVMMLFACSKLISIIATDCVVLIDRKWSTGKFNCIAQNYC